MFNSYARKDGVVADSVSGFGLCGLLTQMTKSATRTRIALGKGMVAYRKTIPCNLHYTCTSLGILSWRHPVYGDAMSLMIAHTRFARYGGGMGRKLWTGSNIDYGE